MNMNAFLFLLALQVAAASTDSCDPAASPDSCIKDQKSDTPYDDTQDATSLLQQKIEMSERLAKPHAAMVDAAKSSTAHSTLKDIEQGFHELYTKWSAFEEDPEFSHLQNDFFKEFESIEESIGKLQIAWHAMTQQNTITSLTQNVLQHDENSLDKTVEGKVTEDIINSVKKTFTNCDNYGTDCQQRTGKIYIGHHDGRSCCCNACNWDWSACHHWGHGYGGPEAHCASWAFEGGSSDAPGDASTGKLAYTDGSSICEDVNCDACKWNWRECHTWDWRDCYNWISIYQGGEGCMKNTCADISNRDSSEHRRRRAHWIHRRRHTFDACGNRVT